MSENVDCPVCQRPTTPFGAVDFNKSCEEVNGTFFERSGELVPYSRCGSCGFVFGPQFLTWSDQDFEENIYNDNYPLVDPENERKRPLHFAKLVDDLFGAHKQDIRHLDYGGGSGLLSRTLSEGGWTSRSYERFLDQDVLSGDEKFDLITAFEVFEHAPHPHRMMEEILSVAHERTLILYTTYVSDEDIKEGDNLDWWYVAPVNGHVSIYTKASLEALARRYGLGFGSFNSQLHCFVRQVPAWAETLIHG